MHNLPCMRNILLQMAVMTWQFTTFSTLKKHTVVCIFDFFFCKRWTLLHIIIKNLATIHSGKIPFCNESPFFRPGAVRVSSHNFFSNQGRKLLFLVRNRAYIVDFIAYKINAITHSMFGRLSRERSYLIEPSQLTSYRFSKKSHLLHLWNWGRYTFSTSLPT